MAELNFHIITLFPEIIQAYTTRGVLGRAVDKGVVGVNTYFLRDFTFDRHNTVDDSPFGGGAGIVLMVEPLCLAVEHVTAGLQSQPGARRSILTSPRGAPLTAAYARELASLRDIIIVCGHYGGEDERVGEFVVDEEISTGDFVLTGGELPALIITDAVSRFIPGVLGNEESAAGDSFEESLLGPPLYTRPAEFRGWKTPDVLTSGNHALIKKWRRERRLERTFRQRPDLLEKAALSDKDIAFLRTIGYPK